MKKSLVQLKGSDTEEFFERVKSRAVRLDRGEVLQEGITISFADSLEMLKILSVERVRLLRRLKRESMQISALADVLARDVRAVSRDVALLEKAGLVRSSYQSNPGHGRLRVVEPVAQEFLLQATL